jgi:hypothetical protein
MLNTQGSAKPPPWGLSSLTPSDFANRVTDGLSIIGQGFVGQVGVYLAAFPALSALPRALGVTCVVESSSDHPGFFETEVSATSVLRRADNDMVVQRNL